MKSGTSRCGLAGLVLIAGSIAACAITRDVSYQVIVDRNVFGLKPPPPPPPPATNPPAPPVTIKLTGITTLGGTKKVLLQYQEPGPGKKMEFPPPLLEGERQAGIEVVSIDAEKGAVKIINGGVETLLTFDKDGIKPTASPGAPGVPTIPAPVPPPPVSAGYVPPSVNPQAQSSSRVVVSGGGNTPSPGGFPNPALYSANAGAAPAIALDAGGGLTRTIPTRPLRTLDLASQTPQQPQMSREEQIVHIEIEREKTKAAVAAGLLPPLPPTELTPMDNNVGNPQGQNQPNQPQLPGLPQNNLRGRRF